MDSRRESRNVATKRGRSGTKVKSKKPAPKPAAKRAAGRAPATATKAARPAAKAAAPTPARRAAPATASTALERAESLRDAIQRSKLTASDPWAYTAKARGWEQRAQNLVTSIVRQGDTAAARQALDKLGAEVDGDRDFQQARRMF